MDLLIRYKLLCATKLVFMDSSGRKDSSVSIYYGTRNRIESILIKNIVFKLYINISNIVLVILLKYFYINILDEVLGGIMERYILKRIYNREYC